MRDNDRSIRPGRIRRQTHDLRPAPFPAVVTVTDWADPQAALAALYEHADGAAIAAIDWYLTDKRGKKRWSRALRAAAIVLVAAGGLQPLLDAAMQGNGPAAWGYVLLALAAACIGFERFFGLSAAWMRDLAAVRAIHRRLDKFRYDWAAECVRQAQEPGLEWAMHRLELLRSFNEDLATLLELETADWIAEFQRNLAQAEWVTELQRTLALTEPGRATAPIGSRQETSHRGPRSDGSGSTPTNADDPRSLL